MTLSLGRLSVIKSTALLDISANTYDARLSLLLAKATQSIESRLGRQLRLGTFDERYTGGDSRKLYLRQSPIISVDSVKVYNGTAWVTEAATCYEVIDGVYIYYPAYGDTTATYGNWPSSPENSIRVKYTAGYACQNWETATITDAFGVPADLEQAVCKAAALDWLEGKGGQARLGMMSMNRGADSMNFEKYIQGWPQDVERTVNAYRRGIF